MQRSRAARARDSLTNGGQCRAPGLPRMSSSPSSSRRSRAFRRTTNLQQTISQMPRYAALLYGILFLVIGATCTLAQTRETTAPDPYAQKDEPPPHGVDEMMGRMRVEKGKKDFNAMLKHGEDAQRLADKLDEKSSGDQREQIV